MTSIPFNKHVVASWLAAVVMLGGANVGPALADTVHLKRGGSLEGKVVEKESTVDVLIDEGSTTFNKTDIARIDKAPTDDPNFFKKWIHRGGLYASSAIAAAKAQYSRAKQALKKKTDKWSKPVGYKEKPRNTIKAISAQEKKRIS